MIGCVKYICKHFLKAITMQSTKLEPCISTTKQCCLSISSTCIASTVWSFAVMGFKGSHLRRWPVRDTPQCSWLCSLGAACYPDPEGSAHSATASFLWTYPGGCWAPHTRSELQERGRTRGGVCLGSKSQNNSLNGNFTYFQPALYH